MKKLAISFVILNLMIGILVYCNTVTGIDEELEYQATTPTPSETATCTTCETCECNVEVDLPQTWYEVAEHQENTSTELTVRTFDAVSLNLTAETDGSVLINATVPAGACFTEGKTYGVNIVVDGIAIYQYNVENIEQAITQHTIITSLSQGTHTITLQILTKENYLYIVPGNGETFLMVQELLTTVPEV